MRKKILFFLVFVLVLNAAGCATVQKKFTRKKKTPSHIPSVIYLESGPYQKKYSNEYYYKTHFTMWKSWQDELLIQLGGNGKKVSRCAQEATSHLTEMSRYLTPEKQALLKGQIDSLSQIMKKMEEQSFSRSDQVNLQTELEKIRRFVANNFYYEKVKNDLLPDTVDLSSAAPDAPKAE